MKKKGRKMQRVSFRSEEYRSEKAKYMEQMKREVSYSGGKKVLPTISGIAGQKRMEARRKMIIRKIELQEKKK